MPNSDVVTDHADSIVALRQTLRNLNNPAQLAQSAWIDSALTKHQMRAEAGTSSVQALRAILDQTLMQLAQTHALCGYDAIQLAAALVIHRMRQTLDLPAMVLVSADQGLNAAATADGLTVEDPNDY